MTDKPALSVVVPVYNGAETVGRLVSELSQLDTQGGMEIILVNDASLDDSASVCAELSRNSSVSVTAIILSRNFGEHNALMSGLRHAKGAYIVTMDDDLQNPPSEVTKLFAYTCEKAVNVVYARYTDKQDAGWRNLGSWFANRTADIMLGADVHNGIGVDPVQAVSEIHGCLTGDGVVVINLPAYNWLKGKHDEHVHGA